MPKQNKTGCKSCDEGVLDAKMLDENGVLCSITGKAGTLCHAYEDMWWPCENKKLIEENNAESNECDHVTEVGVRSHNDKLFGVM